MWACENFTPKMRKTGVLVEVSNRMKGINNMFLLNNKLLQNLEFLERRKISHIFIDSRRYRTVQWEKISINWFEKYEDSVPHIVWHTNSPISIFNVIEKLGHVGTSCNKEKITSSKFGFNEVLKDQSVG